MLLVIQIFFVYWSNTTFFLSRKHTERTYRNWMKFPNYKTSAPLPFPVSAEDWRMCLTWWKSTFIHTHLHGPRLRTDTDKYSRPEWTKWNPLINDTDLSYGLISSIRCRKGPPGEDAKTLDEINEKIKTRPNAFSEMEAFLPNKNGWSLLFMSDWNT